MTKLALGLLKGLHAFVRAIGTLGRPLGRALQPVIQTGANLIVLPIYKRVVLLRIRVGRVLGSAHGFFFLLFTNRYVFHAILLVIAAATLATQLRPNGAAALDAGHRSLLYSIVTDGQDEFIEEEAHPELLAKNADYLGPDTIKGLTGIDYDYEETSDDLPIADLTVPGNIAVQPGNEELNPNAPMVAERTKTEIYVVQDGDTIASIARAFGVNVGTVIWANNLTVRSLIRPGDRLKIPALSGVLYAIKKGDTVEKIAQKYEVKADEIYAANRLTPAHVLALGEELIIPGATPPTPSAPPVAMRPPTTTPQRPSSPVALRQDVPLSRIRGKSYDQYQELTSPATDLRTKPPDATDTNLPTHKLLWPTVQHLINQYYGWRHTGVDINGTYTNPIYAADDGVVEKAGWNSGGYGLMLMIDHQDGYKTRYGHASKLFVQEGDHVKRGQVIAMVGTTGRSTGTHLHFEVYVNGRRVNPLTYIR